MGKLSRAGLLNSVATEIATRRARTGAGLEQTARVSGDLLAYVQVHAAIVSQLGNRPNGAPAQCDYRLACRIWRLPLGSSTF